MPSTAEQDRWTTATFGVGLAPDLAAQPDAAGQPDPVSQAAMEHPSAPLSGGPPPAPATPDPAAIGPPAPDVPPRPPGTISRADATAALTRYFQQALADSGRQTLVVTEAMRTAVRRMALHADGSPDARLALDLMDVLSGKILPGDAAGLAALVTAKLPDRLPAAAIAHLGAAPTTDPKDKAPKSTADAVGKGLADQLAPGLKKLGLSQGLQDKVLDLARKGGAEGLSKGAAAVIGALPLDDKLKAAISALIEAALKQGSTPPDRQQDGKGSPYAPVQPPSQSPGQSGPGTKAPGEKIFKAPPIPWDFPAARPPPRQPAPQTPAAADAPEVARAIAAVAADALTPASVKGTPRADGYPGARAFARAVAEAIAAGQKARRDTVGMPTVNPPYPSAEEQAAALDAMIAIVTSVGAAMPAGGAPVGTVEVSIAAREEGKMAWTRKVHLRGS